MNEPAPSADLSKRQQMVSEAPVGETAAVTGDDWGLKNLAIQPGAVESSRNLREFKFESLSPASSTMFENLSISLEQHVGSNDLRPAYWLEEGAARSRAVCKIDASGVDYEGKTGAWSGTGFLVAPSILCTNHHVLNSKDVAARSRALLDFSALPDGTVRKVSTFRLRPDVLFWTSPVVLADGKGGLDVTFVAIDGDPGSNFGTVPLLRQSFAVADKDRLNIIQHPDGRLKEVAIRNITVTFQDARVIRYESDTETGSSGAPVMNDGWELVGLHHAAADKSNEGIKFSAIAAALELDAQTGNTDAGQLMRLFRGTDELMGFFGSLGRRVSQSASAMERVVDAYEGEDQDVDIGFWNIEWFNNRWEDKLDAVARIVVEMNLDLWVFVESGLEAAEALAKHLVSKYNTGEWGVLASQAASVERQITTVMWNKSTVNVTRKSWPEKVDRWFQVDSRQFPELGLESVHGKVFDRYPALYEVETELRGHASKFNLVPIHLKAKAEGSVRRQMAARLLAEAITEVAGDPGFAGDWIIGGDANATLESGDLDALTSSGLTAISATDSSSGQISYVKAPFKSLIDHIFVSRNLVPDSNDFMIVALDRSIDRFLEVSDHRPILVRLTAADADKTDTATVVPLSEEEVRRLSRGLRRRGDRRTSTTEPRSAAAHPDGRTPYYDANADLLVREDYWAGIVSATTNFEEAISDILERTHGTRLSYNPSKHVYPWVDVRPNGKVQSIYSGTEMTPEFFIQADAEVDRLIPIRL